MNFTSNIFIYFFLPGFISLFLAINFLETKFAVLKKLRILDLLTIFASLVFYVWAGITNVVFLLGLIVVGYVLGFLINKSREDEENRQQIIKQKNYTTFLLTAIGVGAMVTYLYLCKYAGSFGPQLGFISSKNIIVITRHLLLDFEGQPRKRLENSGNPFITKDSGVFLFPFMGK